MPRHLPEPGLGDARAHFERFPVDGGTLVYEREGHGRRLAGFADVDDWNAVRSQLARRGHGVGAIHHLPVFDDHGRAASDD